MAPWSTRKKERGLSVIGRNFSSKNRCPELEMGKNSVTPCSSPEKIPSHFQFITNLFSQKTLKVPIGQRQRFPGGNMKGFFPTFNGVVPLQMICTRCQGHFQGGVLCSVVYFNEHPLMGADAKKAFGPGPGAGGNTGKKTQN